MCNYTRGFELPLYSCFECRKQHDEAESDVPCDITYECYLDWGPAEIPCGYEEAFELLNDIEIFDYQALKDADKFNMTVELIEKTKLLSILINKAAKEYVSSSSNNKSN